MSNNRLNAEERESLATIIKFEPWHKKVAFVLLEVQDILNRRAAAIWDEGYNTGRADEGFDERGMPADPDAHEFPHSNPYVKVD